jgi:hypothetical protein
VAANAFFSARPQSAPSKGRTGNSYRSAEEQQPQPEPELQEAIHIPEADVHPYLLPVEPGPVPERFMHVRLSERLHLPPGLRPAHRPQQHGGALQPKPQESRQPLVV